MNENINFMCPVCGKHFGTLAELASCVRAHEAQERAEKAKAEYEKKNSEKKLALEELKRKHEAYMNALDEYRDAKNEFARKYGFDDMSAIPLYSLVRFFDL